MRIVIVTHSQHMGFEITGSQFIKYVLIDGVPMQGIK